MIMNRITLIEKELVFLGLLDKAKEIYRDFGGKGALSYIRSSYHLLSKVYHPDLNPDNEKKAKSLQVLLNHFNELLSQISDEELISLLKKGLHEETGKKKRILFVEDEFGLQETFRDIFRLEGYDVRVAVDGDDGYHSFLEFRPDLVITDVVMPNLSGIEMVRKIRQDHPRVKVIYVSGFFGMRNVKRDLNEEMIKYGYPHLSKPFKVSAILELIDEYINVAQRSVVNK